jgi:hypothetical protein
LDCERAKRKRRIFLFQQFKRKKVGGDSIVQSQVGVKNWKAIIVNCVISTMTRILGASGKDSILYYLESKGIYPEDAARRPSDFMEAIFDIFGAGTKVLESNFVNEIKRTLGITASARDLADVVEKARHPGSYL